MDNEYAEQQVPLGFLTGMEFDIVTEEDAVSIVFWLSKINEVGERGLELHFLEVLSQICFLKT